MENLSGISGLRIVWIYFYNGGMSAVQRLRVNCFEPGRLQMKPKK